jgi:hypothetical protein
VRVRRASGPCGVRVKPVPEKIVGKFLHASRKAPWPPVAPITALCLSCDYFFGAAVPELACCSVLGAAP